MRTLLPLILLGCIQADASAPVILTNEITMSGPSIPANFSSFSIPPTTLSQTEPVDISSTIQQVEKIGTPSLSITTNHLHSKMGDFAFFQEIAISVVPSDPSVAPTMLIDYKLTPQDQASADLDVPVLVDGKTLVNVFGAGSTSLKFDLTVAGKPPSPDQIDVVSTIGMTVDLQVDKSISDIGQ